MNKVPPGRSAALCNQSCVCPEHFRVVVPRNRSRGVGLDPGIHSLAALLGASIVQSSILNVDMLCMACTSRALVARS